MSEKFDLATPPPRRSAWQRWGPLLAGLAVGLVLGPLFSGLMGWQVPSGALDRRVESAVVRQRARMCAMRARARENPAALAAMSAEDRREVAARYARFPWSDTRRDGVVPRCAAELADAPRGSA